MSDNAVSRFQLDLASDVTHGLTQLPRQLPPRLFYDAEGSRLFEAITEQPEYYLTRTELGILQMHAPAMVAQAGSPLTLVELGVGSAYKTRAVLSALLAAQPRAVFYPVDISAEALAMTRTRLEREFPQVEVRPLEGRYRVALAPLRDEPGRKLVLFIGSSIGNFDPAESAVLLRDVRQALAPGDALLLGTDLRKDVRVLEAAYNDAAGVTARFNLNMLARINRELGADFRLDRFRHVAFFNDTASRIEMHLESTTDQSVRVEALNLTVPLRAGERIHTENSYKFTHERVRTLLDGAGFEVEAVWTDPAQAFAETLARAR